MPKRNYIIMYENGVLKERIEQLWGLLNPCRLCPGNCGARRLEGETGVCQAGARVEISSAFPHFGEEQPLVGRNGSGTIFFTHCNLRCLFCQNYDISHQGVGKVVSLQQLALILIHLQQQGCHNINLVTPTHYSAQFLAALPYAIEAGLELPIVYNCSGYESVAALKLLDGIIDIYMPDAKFASSAISTRYTGVQDYFEVMKDALKEMHRQVGDLEIDRHGIAQKGLLIRHLVMPGNVAGSEIIFKFIADEISPNSYLNVMAQYRPCFKASIFPEISRSLTLEEFYQARQLARAAGLSRGF